MKSPPAGVFYRSGVHWGYYARAKGVFIVTRYEKQRNLMRRSIITFEERPNTRERNRQRASVHSCLGGGNPSDIYLWWIRWINICRMRRG